MLFIILSISGGIRCLKPEIARQFSNFDLSLLLSYGYILDPDLTITNITEKWVGKVKETMPELAHHKVKKFQKHHKLSKEDATVLAQEKFLAELFESVAEEISPKLAAKWLRRELVKVANYTKKELT